MRVSPFYSLSLSFLFFSRVDAREKFPLPVFVRRIIFSPHRIRVAPPGPWLLMLINLIPDFLSVLNSTDRIAAYLRYFDAHRPLLTAYWHNYVLDPDGP